MQSGNVNITIPVAEARGRGAAGWKFGLNYNSQIWRTDAPGSMDPARTWFFGRDVGFGLGWRLLAGSITAVFSDYWAVAFYVFTDSTGAEYRLDRQGAGNTWTTAEPLAVTYEADTKRLRFNDGSWWEMGAESAAGEQDAGSLYPSRMYDSNGNYALIDYRQGKAGASINTSARIWKIWDARSSYDYTFSLLTLPTYTFSYDSSERFLTGAGLVPAYSAVVPVSSPWGIGGAAEYGSASMLESVTKAGLR